MKLEKQGFEGFNLRGIDMLPYDKEHQVYVLSLSKDEEGSLLRGLKRSGADYYDLPFYYKVSGFSIALMISHLIFSRDKPYLIVQEHLGERVFDTKPIYFFFSQFYAVIVPLFFNTMLVFLTYYLGRMFFSDRIGIYAAFMITISPVSILTSHKVWADDMHAAFVILSAGLFLIAQKKQKAWISFLSGISCGISVLAKQTGILITGPILAYSLFINIDKIKDIKKWPSLFFNKHLIAYGLGLTVMVVPWFYKVYSIYGDPLYRPSKPNIRTTDTTGWFQMIGSRPDPIILFSVGIPYQNPLFLLFCATIWKFIVSLRFWNPVEKENKEGHHIVFLWFWLLIFFWVLFFYTGGDEHRRALPSYPPLALLAAYALNKLRIFLETLFKNKTLCEVIILMSLIACAIWSVPMGHSVATQNGALIMRPF
jgi:4-amino-4-deoxy-L-arabinose transferase-like glycosyltransferase